MSIVSLTIWDDLIKILEGIIPSGANQVVSFYGLPPIVLTVIPLIVGIALGIFIKKSLKLVLGLTIIVAVVIYFGVLSWSTLNSYLEKAYAALPLAIQYAAILFTILPLGLGLLIGSARILDETKC